MTGFKCRICQLNKDETEHNFLTKECKVNVCDSCMQVINDKILLRDEAEMKRMKGLEPLVEYLEIRGKGKRPSDKERQEVEDLFGGSMK